MLIELMSVGLVMRLFQLPNPLAECACILEHRYQVGCMA